MTEFDFIVSSSDGTIFSEKIGSLLFRGACGDCRIFCGHAPFVTNVLPGKCEMIFADETKKTGRVKSGILSVQKEQTVLVTNMFEFED